MLPELIAESCQRRPDSVAVSCHDQELTYEQLLSRVQKLAAGLISRSVAPGTPVGVFLGKSVDAYVAMFGIQAAGAVAVPIDPMAPTTVVAKIVEEIGLTTIVVDPIRARKLPKLAAPTLLVGPAITPDTHTATNPLTWDEIDTFDESPIRRVDPSHPAYMITTSGSTGRPKAMVHSHASGLAYAALAADTFGLTHADRLANVAPFHFDISTLELYASPLVGATAVLFPEALLKFPADVSRVVEEQRISVWYSVPTILLHLLERGALDQRDLSCLRWVIFGGEVFPSGPLGRLMKMIPDARFSNVYGPAEVNVCTYHHVEQVPEAGESIPIGRPWADTHVMVVDDNLREVPNRSRGELLVSTTTMMTGYWRRDELNARSIIELEDVEGVIRCWYRTGDVVEWRNDHLMFHGRADRQVKIRGNRVELEAVETAVVDVDGVITCGASVIDGEQDKILIAVVEALPGTRPRDVITGAATVLPPHAVPDEVIIVDSMPRTPSGKVDSIAAVAAVNRKLTGNRT